MAGAMTPRLSKYAREIAFWHGVSTAEIFAKRRGDATVARARADVMRRLRADGFSLPQIGRWMHRDHTTVLYHVRGVNSTISAGRRLIGRPL